MPRSVHECKIGSSRISIIETSRRTCCIFTHVDIKSGCVNNASCFVSAAALAVCTEDCKHMINRKRHPHNEPKVCAGCISYSTKVKVETASPLHCGMWILHSLEPKYLKIAALKQSGGKSGCLEKSLETLEATAVLLYCAHKGKASCGYLGG